LTFALWFDEMRRNRERLLRAKDAVAVGKISGAVGAFAHSRSFGRRDSLRAARFESGADSRRKVISAATFTAEYLRTPRESSRRRSRSLL
jgi:adenylosuccinate lyase